MASRGRKIPDQFIPSVQPIHAASALTREPSEQPVQPWPENPPNAAFRLRQRFAPHTAEHSHRLGVVLGSIAAILISTQPTKTILVRPDGSLAQGELRTPGWVVVVIATLGGLIAVGLLTWVVRGKLRERWRSRKLGRSQHP